MFYSEYNDKVLEEAKKVCDLANERLKNLEKLNAIMNSDCSLENVNGKFTLGDDEKNMLKIFYEETLKNCDEKIVTLLGAVSKSNYHGETVGTTFSFSDHTIHDNNGPTTHTEIKLDNSDHERRTTSSSESNKNVYSNGSPESSRGPLFDNNTTSDDPADDDLPF